MMLGLGLWSEDPRGPKRDGIELSRGIQTGNEPGALLTIDVCRDHHHSLVTVKNRVRSLVLK